MLKVKALLVATMLGMASTANASITIGSNTPGNAVYGGPTPTYDFDAASPPTSGGGEQTGTTSGFAQPLGSTGDYYSVGPSTSSPGDINLSSFGDIFSISLIWGSVDTYNTLQFLDAGGGVLAQFVGNNIFNPANGDQTAPNTNPVVLFNLTGSDVSAFTTLRLLSTQNAFEIDNIAVNPVPEPATWAMMLLGFGAIGFAMRRRRTPVLAQVA